MVEEMIRFDGRGIELRGALAHRGAKQVTADNEPDSTALDILKLLHAQGAF